MIIVAMVQAGSPVATVPQPAAFVYCASPSTSPRGAGLIVTTIFRSRSDPTFVETAFTNYLRSSYAPYGNGWVFPERGPYCLRFDTRREAEVRRSLDISRVPQPVQSIFTVTFQLG